MTDSENKIHHDRPIRCLVLQLGRLSDNFQSLMALRAAKQLYPNLQLSFVARESFAEAAKRVSWIDSVVSFPSEAILGPVLSGEKTDVQTLGDVARWVSPLVTETWDLVINWSYSESSSYLTGLLPARVKLGYSRRKDTSFSSVDGWSHYIQAVVQNEVHQNIHLTDILTTQLLTALQIHFGDPQNEGDAPVTSKSFFNLGSDIHQDEWSWRDISRKWIAVQLGSENLSQDWSTEEWAKLLYRILKENPNYSFVLLGAKSELEKSKTLLLLIEKLLGEDPQSSKHILSLVGQEDFELSASVMSNCQWVFTCDRSSSALASVLGTRVLQVSPSNSRWAETGPYGNGHYIVTSDTSCSDQAPLSAESVYCAWTYGALEWSHRRTLLIQKHAEQLGVSSSLSGIKILRSKIRGTQQGGGVYYEPLVSSGLNETDWMSMVIGHIARAWYCGWVPPVGQELGRDHFSSLLIQRLRELDESARVLGQIYNEASLTALELNKKSQRLKSEKLMAIGDRERIRELGDKLLELDLLVERLSKAQPLLRAFIGMSKVLMHNLQGDGLADLGRETAGCYRQLNEGVSILKEWLQYSLALTKPVAVSARSHLRILPPEPSL